jgi:transposase InsO family protein
MAMATLLRMKMTISPSHSLNYKVVNEDGSLVFEGSYKGGVLVIPGFDHVAGSVTISPLLLHNRLGHPNDQFLKIAFPGVPFKTIDCETCLLLKSSRLPFKGKFPDPDDILDVVHMDLCGPISPPTPNRARYFLIVVDGKSRFRFVRFLIQKSDTFRSVVEIFDLMETQSGKKIKAVVSDNGGEFVNKQFDQYFSKKGIDARQSAPYSPQQNPFAERSNQIVIEKARCLLMTGNLRLTWWAEAVNTAVYLINQTTSSSLNFKTPYEAWYSTKPRMDHLVTFGCEVVYYEEKINRNSKMSPSGSRGILFGYQEGHKNYCIWSLSKNCIKFSHNVRFLDDNFPGIRSGSDASTIDAGMFDLPEDEDGLTGDISGGSALQSGVSPEDGSSESVSLLLFRDNLTKST